MMMAKERNENIVRDTTIMGNFACRVKSKHDIFPLAKFSKHNQAFPWHKAFVFPLIWIGDEIYTN